MQGGVGVGVVAIDDLVAGAGVELADDGLGEGEFGVEGLGAGSEGGDRDGSDAGGQMRRGADAVVAAAGEQEKRRREEDAEAHELLSHWGRVWGCARLVRDGCTSHSSRMRLR